MSAKLLDQPSTSKTASGHQAGEKAGKRSGAMRGAQDGDSSRPSQSSAGRGRLPDPAFAKPDQPRAQFASIGGDLRVAAAADAPRVSLRAANWCGAGAKKPLDWDEKAVERKYKRLTKKLRQAKRASIDMQAFNQLGRFVCKDSGPGRLSWMESYMQLVANLFGVPAALQAQLTKTAVRMDSTEAMKFATSPPDALCDSLKGSTRNTLEQSQDRLRRVGLGCAQPNSPHHWMWDIDRGAELTSAVELTGWVYTAFAYSKKFPIGATSTTDAEKMNIDVYMAALDKEGVSDGVRSLGILRFYAAQMAYQRWQKKFRQELGSDYAELLKAATGGYQQWMADYRRQKTAADNAYQIEHAVASGDKRKLTGCSKTTSAHVSSYIKSFRPKTEDDVSRAMKQPIGVLLAAAAMECERATGTSLSIMAYNDLLSRAPIARGPRYMAQARLAQKVVEIRQNQKRFPLRVRDFRPYQPSRGFGAVHVSAPHTGAGVVSRVDKRGETLTITFSSEARQHPILKCRRTSRIDRITPSGKVIYERKCVHMGSETVMRQEKPVTVEAALAQGVKPGAMLSFARDKRDESQGAPRLVYASKNRKRLINYYGIALD